MTTEDNRSRCHQQLRPHNTKHPTRVTNTTLQQTSSPDITHRRQLNTHYHQTTYLSSPQSTYDMTTDYSKTDGHSPTTRKLTGHHSRKTQSPLSLRPPYPQIYTLPTEFSNTLYLWQTSTTYQRARCIGITDSYPIGCDLESTLCTYDLRKGDLFVLSWASVRRGISLQSC